jgi:GNAT superfamily N-acetyltransferase
VTLSLVPISKPYQKTDFDCGNPELNEYLHLYALKNDKLMIGKTFIARNEENKVTGYVTLATAQVAAASLPDEIRAKLPRYPVPAFLIAKLAVDSRFQGQGVGAWLLRESLKKALEVSASVGLYAVIVDAIDEKAKKFYIKYGFTAFKGKPMTLFLPLATIRDAYTAMPKVSR